MKLRKQAHSRIGDDCGFPEGATILMAIKGKKKNAQPEQVRPRVIISLPNELILEILRWYAAILRSDFIRSQNWNGFPPRLCYKVLRV